MTETIVAPGQDAPGSAALLRARRRRPGQRCIDQTVAARAGSVPPSLLRRAFGGSPVGEAEREPFDSARGERIVGRALDGLPDSWIVLHSLPSPGAGGDLDHVVVGPGGLFAVTTRFADGERAFVAEDYLLVDGVRMPFARSAVAASRRTAHLAGRALPPSVGVRGVVAVAGARSLRSGSRTRVVEVRDVRMLRDWFESLPPVLDDETVIAVATRIASSFEAGETASTLAAAPVSEAESILREDASAAAFARLEREISAARRLRWLWRAAGVVTLAAGIVVAFALLPGWLAGFAG